MTDKYFQGKICTNVNRLVRNLVAHLHSLNCVAVDIFGWVTSVIGAVAIGLSGENSAMSFLWTV